MVSARVSCILAIGTAVPPTSVSQIDFPTFYFGAMDCLQDQELMGKFKRICDQSGIQERHIYLTKEMVDKSPELRSFSGPSLDARQKIGIREAPKLAKEAAEIAIAEWGQPKSSITHLVFGSSSSVDMPGADFQLLKLLGLSPTVKRILIYQQGCFVGGTVIRISKDIAENNPGARVLVVCSEITALGSRAPSDRHLDGLVGSALFGDGAGAVIVGSAPICGGEKSLFEIHLTVQRVLPESKQAIRGHLQECGLVVHLEREVPEIISRNLTAVLKELVSFARVHSYNDLFWVVHPGGIAILNKIAETLQLNEEKLHATRRVLADSGNMSSSFVLFVLDEMRNRSLEAGMKST